MSFPVTGIFSRKVPSPAIRSIGNPRVMPVKSKRDEAKWQKAKAQAAKQGQPDNYALIMGIYKRMKPDYFKEAGVRVAALWLMAKGPLWQQFLDEVYEGGLMMVRNTNRDTKDRYPKVEVLTLLKTDKKFRKLLRAQFEKWKLRRDKEGPPGENVMELADLEPGQTLEWQQGKDLLRGTVQRTRPDRAIVQLADGRSIHMRPWDLESWNPRVV